MALARALALWRPTRVGLFVAAMALAGLAAVTLHMAALEGAPSSAWLAVAVIAVAVTLTDQLTFDLPHGGELERFGLTDAVWVAAIVLAPPGTPTLGAAAGALAWQLLRRVPATKLIFNVGQVALALTAAEAVWGLAGEPLTPVQPAAWALAGAAAAAAFVVNEGTVAAVISLSSRTSFLAALPSIRLTALQWAANVAVGLLAALAWYAHPLGLVLVVPPLVLVWLAHREFIAGLVEREQMQDLADTAERIALERDPSARLPTIARAGRLMDLTASLNRMLSELERASGREQHLMRAAAQGLQAPVRRITSALEHGDASQPDAHERLLADARRVGHVLEEMESVVRAGRPGAVRPRLVPLDDFLHRVEEEVSGELAGRLTVVAAGEDARVRLDARWMERALLQLLDNARVHGRGASRVELRVARAGGDWRFEVADEGGGVPAGHEEAVFEPFYRMSDSGERAGLGLALVRRVAAAHGGSVGIANRPGVGATFWMRLPA